MRSSTVGKPQSDFAMQSLLGFQITRKSKFINDLQLIPRANQDLIESKVALLRHDPSVDAKNKKRLQGTKTNIFRIRAGDYRILYTFDGKTVGLLAVEHRSVVYRSIELYGEDDDLEFVADYVPTEEDRVYIATRRNHSKLQSHWETDQLNSEVDTETYLTRAITRELLEQFRVPEQFVDCLLSCKTVTDLCTAAIPDPLRDQMFDIVTETNYDRLCTRTDFVLESFDDIRRALEGEHIPMLLRLSDEQQRIVEWDLAGAGPTLVKGGPGTGKTVIAAYRIKSILEKLIASGTARPRVLYTTYTGSLVKSAQQLLDSLLPGLGMYVEVRTADSLARSLYRSMCPRWGVWEDEERSQFWDETLKAWALDPDAGERFRILSTLGQDFVFSEINDVIVGREVVESDDYLALERRGRKSRLPELHRLAIWAYYEEEKSESNVRKSVPRGWHHRLVAAKIEAGDYLERYDAVVVDEAQDLSQTLLRIMIAHAPSTDRLFLTADVNQSLYGSGFSWSSLNENLNVRGRSTILRQNYRTTRDIAEVAQGILDAARLEQSDGEVEFSRRGPAPFLVSSPPSGKEASLLSTYLRDSAAALQVGMSSCAVLAASNREADRIAEDLNRVGVEAEFMSAKNLDLERCVVKVMTIHSAKGLEFPIVALAGLGTINSLDPDTEDTPGRKDWADRNRRMLFVGMTRSMFSLLVLVPPRLQMEMATAPHSPGVQRMPVADWRTWLSTIGPAKNVQLAN